MLVMAVSLPSWHTSTRFWGIESTNGGFLIVSGLVVGCLPSEICVSLTYGSPRMSEFWSPDSGVYVVIYMNVCGYIVVRVVLVVVGSFRSQWYMEVCAGINV
jgi:hypothetical protein